MSTESSSTPPRRPLNLKEAAKEVIGDKISLETKDGSLEDFQTMAAEKRKNINNTVAAFLAISLWVILFLIIVAHLGTTIYFSSHLLPSEKSVELEKVQSAVNMVNDAAKTLYSFFGTLVTAVTAYYFKTLDDARKAASKQL